MPRQHPLHRPLHLPGFPLELLARAAARLGRVAGQLYPIDRKQLPPNQPLAVTHYQHLGEHLTQRCAPATDKRRQRGEVRCGSSTDRHKEDILLTRAFDGAGTHQSSRIGQEDNLEQQGRGVGWRAALVVAKTLIKRGEIHLMVNQLTQGKFKGARQNLTSEINAHKLRTHINRLVARHRTVLPRSTNAETNMSPRCFLSKRRMGFPTASTPELTWRGPKPWNYVKKLAARARVQRFVRRREGTTLHKRFLATLQ